MENAKEYDAASAFQERFKELVGNSTQEEVARKVNSSRQNVGNWINGKSRPDIYALSAISKGFNVSVDYLLGLTDTKSSDIKVREICEYTGLSEKAVELLSDIKFNYNVTYTSEIVLTTLNFLITQLQSTMDYKDFLEDFYFENTCLIYALYKYIFLEINPYNDLFYISSSGKLMQNRALNWDSTINDNHNIFDYLPIQHIKVDDVILNTLLENICDILKSERKAMQKKHSKKTEVSDNGKHSEENG